MKTTAILAAMPIKRETERAVFAPIHVSADFEEMIRRFERHAVRSAPRAAAQPRPERPPYGFD